jgi:hypothetical protein
MSRRVYANGVLLEEWDDATLTYRRYVNGEVVETRAYTGPEVAAIVGAGAVILSERQMLVIDDDGTEIFRIGDMEHGDRGLVIRREDGSIAISLSQAFPGAAQQEIRIFDRFGNELLTEEAIGSGPAYPIFPLIFEPVLATAGTVNAGPYGFEVPTTSGTFVTVFRTTLARNNQFGTVKLRVAASDTSTSGELRLINVANNSHLGQFLAGPYTGTRSTGSTAYVEVSLPSLVIPGNPWDPIELAVQVRRTAGAGTLRVAVDQSRGG